MFNYNISLALFEFDNEWDYFQSMVPGIFAITITEPELEFDKGWFKPIFIKLQCFI